MAIKKTIVVVEDDEAVRIAIERFLGAAGFRTVVYESAEAMLADEEVKDAACVVSDIKLPAMSGLELLDEMRRHAEWPPAVMITAHDSPGMRDEARRHGAAEYLAKPFQGEALLAAIDSATGTARLGAIA